MKHDAMIHVKLGFQRKNVQDKNWGELSRRVTLGKELY